ncbi:MAG TPA: polysaccharide deacetylase family protein [Spirochaetia bacterium]|nr:polysaccharide deacetylase family protein [Spirochaetia bacterium]
MNHRRTSLVFTALLVCALAGAQAPLPPRRDAVHVPPPPRDGQGGVGVVVPILIYHSIRPYETTDTRGARRWIATPEALDAELAWLRAHDYTSVTFDQLEARLDRDAPLPPRPVIISFDDDWQSQWENAVPLLHHYGFTATFFVWVRAVGRPHHMSWDEIQELDAQGMEIGCHTMTHLYLTRLKSDEQLRQEIVAAKDLIEAHIGHPVTTLAYPFGQYDERVVQVARDAGFTTARSTWPGVFHTTGGLLSLTGLIRTESAAGLEETLGELTKEAAPEPAGDPGVTPGPEPMRDLLD